MTSKMTWKPCSSSASEIVNCINLLMANKWGKQAWDKVSHTTMAKCFKKTGLYPDSDNTDEDPFEGEELQDVSRPPPPPPLDRLDAPCNTWEYIVKEDELNVCQALIDSIDPNWRQAAYHPEWWWCNRHSGDSGWFRRWRGKWSATNQVTVTCYGTCMTIIHGYQELKLTVNSKWLALHTKVSNEEGANLCVQRF